MSYSALAGTAAGWVDFFGITKLSKGLTKGDDGVLCLVFERAKKGNLKEFLQEFAEKDDWGFILETLKGVGNGLNVLHKRGIAHRYMWHPHFC